MPRLTIGTQFSDHYVRNPPQAMTLADRRPPTHVARQMNSPQSIAAAIAAITPSSMNVTFDIGRLNTVKPEEIAAS